MTDAISHTPVLTKHAVCSEDTLDKLVTGFVAYFNGHVAAAWMMSGMV